MVSLATLCTGCIPNNMMMTSLRVCVYKTNFYIQPTVSIHVAAVNSTGSYMTVLAYLLLLVVV